MRVVFRTDASIQIGTGHAMRCLTLANALRERGVRCEFICRAHSGNLAARIDADGHRVHLLPVLEDRASQTDVAGRDYDGWLGASWESDAEETAVALAGEVADWLVVDHYAIDARWEARLRPHAKHVMVIDDLADRQHDCELLLDQTVDREAVDYQSLVPRNCRILAGAQFALLRPEFPAMRMRSLNRRAKPVLRHVLVSMGGVDKDNVTGRVMTMLAEAGVDAVERVSVVLGGSAPLLSLVLEQARGFPLPIQVLVDVRDMAALLGDVDLAIGGAGTATWERCCLGVPTLVIVLAANQRRIAETLGLMGAAEVIGEPSAIASRLVPALRCLAESPSALVRMSHAASKVTSGGGTNIVATELEARGA